MRRAKVGTTVLVVVLVGALLSSPAGALLQTDVGTQSPPAEPQRVEPGLQSQRGDVAPPAPGKPTDQSRRALRTDPVRDRPESLPEEMPAESATAPTATAAPLARTGPRPWPGTVDRGGVHSRSLAPGKTTEVRGPDQATDNGTVAAVSGGDILVEGSFTYGKGIGAWGARVEVWDRDKGVWDSDDKLATVYTEKDGSFTTTITQQQIANNEKDGTLELYLKIVRVYPEDATAGTA
jgi:hypothetical protein